jgi:hypothetical protein
MLQVHPRLLCLVYVYQIEYVIDINESDCLSANSFDRKRSRVYMHQDIQKFQAIYFIT